MMPFEKAQAPVRHRDAEEGGAAGGDGEDTRALQHRHHRRHLQACEDGGDARGAQEVCADEQ